MVYKDDPNICQILEMYLDTDSKYNNKALYYVNQYQSVLDQRGQSSYSHRSVNIEAKKEIVFQYFIDENVNINSFKLLKWWIKQV